MARSAFARNAILRSMQAACSQDNVSKVSSTTSKLEVLGAGKTAETVIASWLSSDSLISYSSAQRTWLQSWSDFRSLFCFLCFMRLETHGPSQWFATERTLQRRRLQRRSGLPRMSQ